MNPQDAFRIPPAPWQETEKALGALAHQASATVAHQSSSAEVQYGVPPKLVAAMARIATHVWKARAKMLDSSSGEVREEMKRVYRHIDAVFETLHDIHIEVKDHTNDPFDYGLPLKVVSTQPAPGITKERVIETIRPTVYWQNHIIQMGEVVIAAPQGPQE